MEAYDINRIHIVLLKEFSGLFSPERRRLADGRLIYEGILNNRYFTDIRPLIKRFQSIGYDVQVIGSGPRVTFVFSYSKTVADMGTAQPKPILPKERYGKHLLLFGLTLISTLWAGALQYNVDVFENPARIWMGIPFAIPLLLILLAHEMGHYILSLRHKIRSTLPYFIPFPNIIGTMGAVIKMKSPIPDRKALIDVGMAGPLAGAAVAIPVTFIGLMMSDIIVEIPSKTAGGIMLGESLLFKILTWLIYGHLPSNTQISLHPVAFAGWVGLLVTFMNLFPVSQLDGGHISYALFGSRHKLIGQITCLVFAILGIFYWPWLIWMLIVFFIGLRHPPPMDDIEPIDRERRILGMICIALFALTFIPKPFYGPDFPIDLMSLLRELRVILSRFFI
ncbi:site-2 protease family protein [bacterium]|nr:site-2 protease family protein [bacterium]